ncbi:hypothetical protein [Streptomyces sp. NPDC059224]|uniref:hypothetical protein n=1 Tax=Streptomyces sp. NPDC059224 TaxID=3346775 RepID=UPI0036B3225C
MRRLAGLLNRAMAEDDALAAARHCVTTPFRARTLAPASADEGRLWVLGHSGASADPAAISTGPGRTRGHPRPRPSSDARCSAPAGGRRSAALRDEENTQAEHGRGLLIVEALSGSWNSSPNGRGKTVSVEVPVGPPPE